MRPPIAAIDSAGFTQTIRRNRLILTEHCREHCTTERWAHQQPVSN